MALLKDGTRIYGNATIDGALTTGGIGYFSDIALFDDSSPSHYLLLTNSANLTAQRTLSVNVNNADRSITLSGNLSLANNFTTSGNFAVTLTATAATSVTLPSSGTLATTAGTLSSATTSTQSGYFGDIFLYDDSTPSHYLGITNSANLTAARTLSINVNDANRTISLSGDLTVSAAATVSGTNTGDQTITLTGDVTGSGTGSFAATLANSGVTAGTYKSVTVDAKGRVTAGTNPTTLSGFGITDALSNSTTSTQSGYFGDIFLYDDSTPSHYLGITNSANLTAARTLSLNVNNADRTISLSGNLTLANNFTTSGNFAVTLTATAATSVTLPTSGTLATTGNLSQFAATTSAQLAGVISDETGSGALVFATSPTLTTPQIASDSSINDSNGNELIKFPAAVASAVNQLEISNAATGNAVLLTTSGGDTDIGLNISTKGTGAIVIDTGTGAGQIDLKPGSSNVRIWDDNSTHYYQFVTGDRTANYNITLPAGNVTLQSGTMATTGNLSQFAATTSAQLAGVISDETGSGALVFGTSPSFTTAINTGSTTFSLVNATATTVNFAGAATSLTVGATTGTTTVRNNLVVTGNLTINGTTTTVNSTVTTLDDPILTLGGDTSTVEITKDRGIEFKWSGETITITNYIGNGTTTVTGTVASTTGWVIGDIITIGGATGTEQTKLNGTWTIASVPNSTTFTFVVSSTVAAGTYTTATVGTTIKSKNGFFGFDQSSQLFKFIPQANNSSEVFSGTLGDISVRDGYFSDIHLYDDSSPSHYLKITNTANLTAARTLSINTGDSDRSITLSGNLSLANNFTTSGNFALTLTTTAATNVTLPTSGTLATTAGTLSSSTTSTQSGYFGDVFLYDDIGPSHYLQITNSGNLTGTRTLSINVSDGNRSIALAGNLSLSNSFTLSGGHTVTFTTANNTSLSLPTSGLLATTAVATDIAFDYATSAANAVYQEVVSYELDDISTAVDGIENTFVPKFNYNKVSITDPFKLLITVNGIIQSAYVFNKDYVHLTHCLASKKGYTIDHNGNIKFTESIPMDSEIVTRFNGSTTNSVYKYYPFSALDIMLYK